MLLKVTPLAAVIRHFLVSQLTQPWSNLSSRLEVKGWDCCHISKSKIARKIVSNYSPKSLIALKKMCVSDRKWPSNNTRRLHRREWSVIKKTSGSVLTVFPLSGLLRNPFVQEMESLVNFAAGVVLTSNVAEGLVSSNEKGREQTKNFEHWYCKSLGFFSKLEDKYL